MARISTYEIDTVIHADDNVIGTDPSSNNATRLYPVSSLANFIREGYSRVFDAEVEFGTAADTDPNRPTIPANGVLQSVYLPQTAAFADEAETTTGTVAAQLPTFTYTHNFNTRNIVVMVWENVQEYVFSDTSTTNPQANNSYVSDGLQDVTGEVDITIVDENNVTVGFGTPRPISGNVIIIG